jgi:hypothetical protein
MGREERRRHLFAEGSGFGGGSAGLLIAGLVVVGLGALAFYTLGPDIKRYKKIRDM